MRPKHRENRYADEEECHGKDVLLVIAKEK